MSCNHSAVSGTSVWSSNLERDFVPRGSSRVRILGGGKSGGGPPNQRNPYWMSGLGRGRVGSCLGRGRVEVASRSGRGRILGLCSVFVNERTPVRFITSRIHTSRIRGDTHATQSVRLSVSSTVLRAVSSSNAVPSTVLPLISATIQHASDQED